MSPEPVRCVVLGGGGHARVVIDTLRLSQAGLPHVVLDADPRLWGKEALGVPILGGDQLLPQLAREGITHFLVGLGGTGDNAPRRALFTIGQHHGLIPLTICHPSAACSSWARLGVGTVVCPLAVINAGATLGINVIVNTGAIVEHDCQIGDHVHLATGATLCGTVSVGVAAHVGAGATVRQDVKIGEGAVVGAGAVVIRDVASWTVVGGVPARVLGHRAPGGPLPSSLEQEVAA